MSTASWRNLRSTTGRPLDGSKWMFRTQNSLSCARIRATRCPGRETVTHDSLSVPLAMIQELTRYWASVHDWRNPPEARSPWRSRCSPNEILKAPRS